MAAIRGLEEGRNPALLISECQNAITNSKYTSSGLVEQVEQRQIIKKIGRLAAAFRARGLPVIHTTIAARDNFEGFVVNCALAAQIRRQGKLVTGTANAAVHDDLPVHPTDIIAERMHGMSAFSGTELDALLRGLGVDTLIMAGVSTNVALPGCATEAVARYYNVVLAEDCTAGGTAETHHMQVTMHLPLLATISDSNAIIRVLGGGG